MTYGDFFANWFEAAIKPVQVDGWYADEERNFNHYKYDSRKKTYTLLFRRYIDPVTGKPVPVE